jgi:hypothetical protein
MALPKLNDNLKYEMVIPSTDKLVTYRPYLVKEEKLLLSAFESKDQKQAMRAMVDTVVACVNDDIKTSELSTFDVEYMFTQIRSKSVGESSTLRFKCEAEECEKTTDVDIDLTSVEITKPENSGNVVELTDDISIELRYPTYDGFVKNYREGVSIMTEDEQYLASDVSKKELSEFIDSMTNKQFEKIGEYLKTVPVMKKEVEFTCQCGHENKVTLEGLQDFF